MVEAVASPSLVPALSPRVTLGLLGLLALGIWGYVFRNRVEDPTAALG